MQIDHTFVKQLLFILTVPALYFVVDIPSSGAQYSAPVQIIIGVDPERSLGEERRLAKVSATCGMTKTSVSKARIWVRGSSSQVRPKRPYRIELQDEQGCDYKESLLGMPEESDWILYPSYIDKTFVRDVLAYDLWREMGWYAPRHRFVELFIVTNTASLRSNVLGLEWEAGGGIAGEKVRRWENEQGFGPHPNPVPVGEGISRHLVPQVIPPRNENWPEKPWYDGMPDINSVWPGISKDSITWQNYRGIYILMEKIKRGKDRVNIKKLKPEHRGEPAITGGYIFKKDRLNYGEKGFRSKSGIEFAFEEPKEKDITPAQRTYLTNYINEFEEVLFSENFSDPGDGYRKYIDIDSFVDYHWMTELSRNVDGYWFSVFFHKDRGGKLKIGPIWDYDLAFANAYHQNTSRTNGWRWDRLTDNAFYRWYARLFEDPDFFQRYIDRWAELRTNIFATSNILAKIDRYIADVSSDAIERNYERWPTLGRELQQVAFTGNTYQEEVDWLKKWIAGRLAWIDTQDFPPPVFVTTPLSGGSGVELKLGWIVGRVFYTLDGSDPRLSGGTISPKALEYSDPVLLVANTRFCARVRSDEGLWSARKVLTTP